MYVWYMYDMYNVLCTIVSDILVFGYLHLQKILGFFVNANAIVEFEEWSIASIIRVGRSRRGVKTLL